MADEFLVAQAQWLPQYTAASSAAEARLAAGNLIPTRSNYEGAARLQIKTVEEMQLDREAASKNAGEADKAKERLAAKH